MNLMNLRIALIFVALCCFALAQTPVEKLQPLLQWQSSAGTQLAARFVSLDNGNVVLRTAEGREISVSLNDLEAGSRAQALDLNRASTAKAATLAQDSGNHRLRVYSKSAPFTLDVLENGTPLIYGPIIARVEIEEQVVSGRPRIFRWAGMMSPATENPQDSLWHARMTNGMQVEIRLRNSERQLALSWVLIAKDGLPENLRARVSLVFPPLDKKANSGTALKIDAQALAGPLTSWGPDAPADSLVGAWSHIGVALPGSHTNMHIRAPAAQTGTLGLHVDEGKHLSDGFRIDTYLQNPLAPGPAAFLIDFQPQP